MNEVEKIREELENNEAKCLYCGRKMESLLEQLQSSIDVMALPEDVEDSVFLSIAGLKQVGPAVYMYIHNICNINTMASRYV